MDSPTSPSPDHTVPCPFRLFAISHLSADQLAPSLSVPQLGRVLTDLLFLLAVTLPVPFRATAGEGVSISVHTGSPVPRSGLLSRAPHDGFPTMSTLFSLHLA